MKLNKSDIDILLSWGYPEKDIPQIKLALKYLRLEDYATGKRISKEEAYNRLGQKDFLSGLGRAAFHWDCERSGIGFDCHKLFSEETDIKEFSYKIRKLLKNDFWNYVEISKEVAKFIIKQEKHYGWGNWVDSDVSAIIRHLTGCDTKTSDKLALEIRGL